MNVGGVMFFKVSTPGVASATQHGLEEGPGVIPTLGMTLEDKWCRGGMLTTLRKDRYSTQTWDGATSGTVLVKLRY